jgi:hypothetical protein
VFNSIISSVFVHVGVLGVIRAFPDIGGHSVLKDQDFAFIQPFQRFVALYGVEVESRVELS